MPRFSYKAMRLDGRTFDGEAEAISLAALASDLARRDLMLIAHTSKPNHGGGTSGSKADPRVVTALFTELALMLRSGLPIDEALELAGRGAPAQLARTLAAVRTEVRGGTSISQALERQAATFGSEIGPLARVAEVTGDFEGMLRALAEQRERAQKLQAKLTGALQYPAFLVVSAASVLIFFLIHVIPQFSNIFADSQNDPGVLVRTILAASNLLVAHESEFGMAFSLLMAAGLLAWRAPAPRAAIKRFFLNLPGVRGIAILWRASRFLSILGVLLSQGVPLNRALQLLEPVVGEASREDLRRAGDAIRRGDRLQAAMAENDLLPPLALRMLGIGEGTGELAKLAHDAGLLYEHKLERRLDAVTAIIGPAAIVLIAVLIGGLMVTIMSALMSVDQSVF